MSTFTITTAFALLALFIKTLCLHNVDGIGALFHSHFLSLKIQNYMKQTKKM